MKRLRIIGWLPKQHHPLRIVLILSVALLGYAGTLQSDLSVSGRRTIAVTLFMALMWVTESAPIAVTALLPIALFPLLGILPSAAVAPNYANHLIFLFLGGFMIAVAMQRWHLHRRIALATILVVGVRPTHVLLGFMIATAFLSMWISNTATAMMIFPIAVAVVTQLSADDATKERSMGTALMLAVAYSANIGGMATLVGTPPNIILAGLTQKLYPELPPISFAGWMGFALPLVLLLLVIVWALLAFVFFPNLRSMTSSGKGTRRLLRQELKAMGPMSSEERRVVLIFVATAFLWIFRAPLHIGAFTIPGWSMLMPAPGMVHDATVAMFMGLMLFLIPAHRLTPDGESAKRLLSWSYFENRAPWSVLFLFGGGFALAAGLKESGVTAWIAGQLLAFSGVNGFVLLLATCLTITFLTEVTSNTATTSVILPILGPVAIALGLHPLPIMIAAALSASCAFMLPVATPPNAIVFSCGWIRMAQMARVGFFINVIGAVVVSAAVYWLSTPMLKLVTHP